MCIRDRDKDGDLDAIATARDTDTIAWYENQGGGAFRRRLVDDTAIGPYGLFATDLDFDGDVDIVSASATSDTVAIHRQMRAHVARLAPGATLVLDGTRLRTVDAESAPARLTYSVLELPRNGELRLHSVALAAGGTFTQADVDSGRLSYVQVAPGATGDRFTFDVRDGGANGVRPAPVFLVAWCWGSPPIPYRRVFTASDIAEQCGGANSCIGIASCIA